MDQMRPAYSDQFTLTRLSRDTVDPSRLEISPLWAWAGGTGKGIHVAVVDSGVDANHPAIAGRVERWAAFEQVAEGEIRCTTEPHGDAMGHGTACADIILRLAPEARIVSVNVMGRKLRGKGPVFAEALRWVVQQPDIQVVNLSLGSTKAEIAKLFYEISDVAYFRKTILVTAANNMPVQSFPSLYASVLSVACHPGQDPYEFFYNPTPPPEFGAPGVDIKAAWKDGATLAVTGNSFAAPHITGLIAKILSKHPGLTPFEVKTILRATARNAG